MMKKLLVISLGVLIINFLLLIQPPKSVAQNTWCNVSVSPVSGEIGSTNFEISGKFTITGTPPGYVKGGLIGTGKRDPITTWIMDVDVSKGSFGHSTTFSNIQPGEYSIAVYYVNDSTPGCSTSFFSLAQNASAPPPTTACKPPTCNYNNSQDPSKWTCDDSQCETKLTSQARALPLCACVPGSFVGNCLDGQGIQTGLGCIPFGNVTQFTAWFLRFAIGIGGGIAFLLMLFGVFQIITSAGDPERLKAGKETITSALIGLLMIIFSLFLLQLIGVQILQIPGFAKPPAGEP